MFIQVATRPVSRLRTYRACVFGAVLLSAAGCSTPGGSSSGFGTNSSSGTSGTSGASGTSGTSGTSGASGTIDPIEAGTSSSGGPVDDGCSDAAKLVYVISDTGELYSFKPDTLIFTRIGLVTCAGAGGGYNSMAVDRTGTAWVNSQGGGLFKVSTKNASCSATSYRAQTGAFKTFGMAFSSNSPGSKDETLYVASNADIVSGEGLGQIDTTSFAFSKVGNYGGAVDSTSAELTGTGSAKLFGFFTTDPARFGEIAKASAAAPSTRALAGVSTGSAFAFSFWGGDFWFYTAQLGSTSSVTRLKEATDKTISVVKSNLGFRIVGAGVSTCAPIVPPVPN